MRPYLFSTLLLFLSITCLGQTKNFIDQPYVEVSAKVDTLVTADRIYLSILLNEKDKRNKLSVEEMEQVMAAKLEGLGINLQKQLTLTDLGSNFKKYFLKPQDILKSKAYQLELYDTQTAGMVMVELEKAGISNVDLDRTDYSKKEQLLLGLKSEAVEKAKQNAAYLLTPLDQKITYAMHITHTTSTDNYILNEIVVSGYRKKSENKEPLDIEFKPLKYTTEVHVKFAISHRTDQN